MIDSEVVILHTPNQKLSRFLIELLPGGVREPYSPSSSIGQPSNTVAKTSKHYRKPGTNKSLLIVLQAPLIAPNVASCLEKMPKSQVAISMQYFEFRIFLVENFLFDAPNS